MQSGVSSLVDVGVHLLRVFISKICLVGLCPSCSSFHVASIVLLSVSTFIDWPTSLELQEIDFRSPARVCDTGLPTLMK